jgi:hypothetical protein
MEKGASRKHRKNIVARTSHHLTSRVVLFKDDMTGALTWRHATRGLKLCAGSVEHARHPHPGHARRRRPSRSRRHSRRSHAHPPHHRWLPHHRRLTWHSHHRRLPRHAHHSTLLTQRTSVVRTGNVHRTQVVTSRGLNASTHARVTLTRSSLSKARQSSSPAGAWSQAGAAAAEAERWWLAAAALGWVAVEGARLLGRQGAAAWQPTSARTRMLGRCMLAWQPAGRGVEPRRQPQPTLLAGIPKPTD